MRRLPGLTNRTLLRRAGKVLFSTSILCYMPALIAGHTRVRAGLRSEDEKALLRFLNP